LSASRSAEEPPREDRKALLERASAVLRAGLGALSRALRGRRLEVATAFAILGGALLVVGEFLNLYEVKRGVVVVAERTSGDHHSYALLVAGCAAIGAMLLARSTGAWPPAAAAAAIGLAALAVALLGDLPDATSSGLTVDRRLGSASPAAGFWVELAGALLTTGGAAAAALMLRR
jgi:hypothetical protein